MTKKELKNLIEEREHVELKSSLSLINEIIEAVSAFSNAEGGKIIIGVNNSGKVLGVEIGKGTLVSCYINNLTFGLFYDTLIINEYCRTHCVFS